MQQHLFPWQPECNFTHAYNIYLHKMTKVEVSGHDGVVNANEDATV